MPPDRPDEGERCPTCGLEGPFPDVFEEPLPSVGLFRRHQEQVLHGEPRFVFSMALRALQDHGYHVERASVRSGSIFASSLTRVRNNGPGGKALSGVARAHLALLLAGLPSGRVDTPVRIRADILQEWRFQETGLLHRRGLVLRPRAYEGLFERIGANMVEFGPRGARNRLVFRDGADGDADQADRRRRP